MMKIGLDQVTAWILAIGVSGSVFGGGYLLSKYASKYGAGHDDEHVEHASSVHGEGHDGGEHGESHDGDGHGESHDGGDGHDKKGHGAGSHSEHGTEPEGNDEPGAAERGDHAEHGDDHGDNGGHGAGKLAAKAIPHWEYKGSSGPESWGALAETFKSCDNGKQQSPVDIDAPATNGKLLPIRFHYKLADVTVRNNGHTIQADFPIGNYVEIEGERYDLAQLHFHSPSEHKVAGIPYDLEMHLVHKNAEGGLAVVGIMYEEGRESAALKPLWKAMPDEVGTHHEPIAMDVNAMLPKKRQFYHYNGSLTTPPCSEGVKWFVMVEPLEVSSKQVDQFVQIVKFNARPVQPLLGRRVSKSTR